jgi:hypothetical protein
MRLQSFTPHHAGFSLIRCDVSLLHEDVLWPKDWMTHVLPPKGGDKWFYIIHERVEPPPRDDIVDPLYSGGSAIVLSGVPIQCEDVDLKTWLLFGVAQDFVPLKHVTADMELARKKKLLLKQKLDALPTMDIEGSPEQQAETRKKLAEAVESHAARYDGEHAALAKRKARIEKLLFTEPLTLAPIDEEVTQPSGSGKQQHLVETRSWVVQFTSSRGQELATVAMAKCDWNYVCLAQTRPTPTAFLEEDQVEGNDGAISARGLGKEVNMRTVRLKRLRHGSGELLTATADDTEGDETPKPMDPSADDFHFSSLGALYAGEFRLGEKHGRGREVTNVGVYEGEFEHDKRYGAGKLVYGKGTTCWGTFTPAVARRYDYGKKAKGKECTPSLLNGDSFRQGAEHGERMRIQFPDGATYDGEMVDGRICGFGRYVSSTGVVEEGIFINGVLTGESCRREFPNGAIEIGAFVDGELHGRGHVRDKNGDEYDGFFEHGVRQGRGRARFLRGQCKHVGFWRENAMDGRGDFLYADRSVLESHRGDDRGDNNDDKPIAGTTSSKKQDVEVLELTESNNNQEEGDDVNGFLGGGKWRYWYEGGFLHGETRARHRHVDLKSDAVTTANLSSDAPRASPFTTNAKSSASMPFLTSELPLLLAKADRRGRANAKRRVGRERAFLEQRERDNLTLYYSLLDGFYEQWTARKQFQRRVGEMESEHERQQAERELEAQEQFEAQRERRRKEKYDLLPPKRDLLRFEEHLERITLTEHVSLQRAVAADVTQKKPL